LSYICPLRRKKSFQSSSFTHWQQPLIYLYFQSYYVASTHFRIEIPSLMFIFLYNVLTVTTICIAYLLKWVESPFTKIEVSMKFILVCHWFCKGTCRQVRVKSGPILSCSTGRSTNPSGETVPRCCVFIDFKLFQPWLHMEIIVRCLKKSLWAQFSCSEAIFVMQICADFRQQLN